MSSDETILHLYRSLLNAVHNQYNRTLATMESIEQGMRQTITQNRTAASQDIRTTFSSQNAANVPAMPSIFSRLATPNVNLNQSSYSRNNMNNISSSSSNSHTSRRSRSDTESGSGTEGRSRNVRSRVRGRQSDNTDTSSSSQVETENNDQTARIRNTTSTFEPTTIFSNNNAGSLQNPGVSNGFTFTSPSFSPLGGLTTIPPNTFSIVNEPTLTSMWNSFANGFDNQLDHLTPVIVRPSDEEIERATETLVFHQIENPQTLSCPISLDPLNQDDEILRIKFCGHYFLKEKIIPWFNSHVHCPLCRYDIREWRENDSNSNAASSSDSATPSNTQEEDQGNQQQQQHINDDNAIEEEAVGASSDNDNNDNSNSNASSSVSEEERGSSINRRNQPNSNSEAHASRDNNTRHTMQDPGIQNIIEILTNEMSNHMAAGATGDTLRIELETHPIRMPRNSENEEDDESTNNL